MMLMLKQYVALQVWFATRPYKAKSKGQSLAEYGLILALVAVFCIAALQLLGNNITTMLNKLSGSIGNVASGIP
jgi:Flp pilus assembly pilin Flp